MELFDKRFVYFMWDDKLEGKKGFVANYINDLKLAVNQGYWTKYGTLHKGSDAYPFRTIVDERWCLCYCDPNYEIKKAFNEGKKVQVYDTIAEDWVDCDEPEWVDGCQFRVKPECPCEEGIDSKACVGCPQDEERKQTFRPFKDCDELVEFWSKNYQTGFRPAYTKPLIWVRLKCDGRERLIVAFGKGFGTDFVEIGNKAKAVPLQKLFDDYEFLDGNPCGMEVKE